MNIKAYRIMLSLLILLIIIAVLAVFVSYPKTPKENPQKNAQPIPAEYTLREYDDKIGVFRETEAEPFMMIDVYVSNLPTVDQMELRNGGIEVADDQKLQTLIEDFGS